MPEDNSQFRLIKWPFYTGDGLLVLLTFLIVAYSERPLSSTAISWCVISITFGALIFVAPFILEYLNSIRLAKNHLQETVDKQLQSLDTTLQELDAISSTLSDLAQKSANSTAQIDKFKPELKNQLKNSCARIDSILESAQDKVSIDKSLSEVLNKRLESLGNKVNELVSMQSIKVVREAIEEKVEEDKIVEPEENNITEEQNSATVLNPSIVDAEFATVDITDNSLEEKVVTPDSVENPDPVSALENQGQDAKKMSVSTGGNSITLIAHLNIDISSTPFVRGEGAGLSWNEGAPMKFIEIGKWEFKIDKATEAASCHIFKDDVLAAKGDDIVINVGERSEVYPVFPEG